MKWFRIWGEKWLLGSTRWELTIEQRAIWQDLLAKASISEKPGQIDYFLLEQLAQQFNVPLDLLESTIKRCGEVRKIKHFPKKRRIKILNWKKYQSEYERQKPYRQQHSSQSKVTKNGDNFSNKVTLRKEGEEKRKEIEKKENREDKKKEESLSTNKESINSPLPSTSKSFSEGGITKKEQFLSLLRTCKGYPFDEGKDSLLFDIILKDCPGINIVKQTEKKISWWEEHPDALKEKTKSPRKQLEEWFRDECAFQKRGGPQKIGEIGILKEIEDKDHQNFIKELAGLKEKPKKKD